MNEIQIAKLKQLMARMEELCGELELLQDMEAMEAENAPKGRARSRAEERCECLEDAMDSIADAINCCEEALEEDD